jgi:hypothetical protein
MRFKQLLSENEEGTIRLTSKKLQRLPADLPQEVAGNFLCNKNSLSTLEGCPQVIHGNFLCENNLPLKSLVGGPRKVGGKFYTYNCPFESFQGMAQEIGSYIHMRGNHCKNFVGFPQVVNAGFDVSITHINSLEGFPRQITGDVFIDDSKITSLHGIHKRIDFLDGVLNIANTVTSHVLSVLLIKKLHAVNLGHNGDFGIVTGILNRYVGKGHEGLIEAQAELIEAGLEEYAQV